MDVIHKRLINKHILALKGTSFERLLDALEKLDGADKNTRIIPDTLLQQWKGLKTIGYDERKANEKLYCDIQKRGPRAFQLLVNSLNLSGQNHLACLLDPTIRVQETDNEGEEPIHEFYSDEGIHYFRLDQSWNSECYRADFKAVEILFLQLGFKPLPDDGTVEESSLGSLVVVNFCALENGGRIRENAWLEKFTDPASKLFGKPKILISIRYKGMQGKSVEHDSGMSHNPHKDILQLKILVTPSADKSAVSEVMQHVIQIFGRDDSIHLNEKVTQVNKVLKGCRLSPIISVDVGFSKRFRLKKTAPDS